MTDELALGLHERLVTEHVREALVRLDASRLHAEVGKVDEADAPELLARHVATIARRALRGRTLAEQAAICARALAALSEGKPFVAAGEGLSDDIRQLLAVAERDPAGAARVPARPGTPLTGSALFTNGPEEPSIGAELRRELASADRVDLLCAFVLFHGVRALESALSEFFARGGTMRVLTSTYRGATEPSALERLVELGADVRVGYEVGRTRLHAKAWLFQRATGYSTAYVGSSNLSRSAMLDGLEWNVRLSHVETPHLLEKFRATFESYWSEEKFEPFDPTRDHERLVRALGREKGGTTSAIAPFELRPYPHQERILEALHVERMRHGRTRNLVVAATGTGKTVLAAFDYKRLRGSMGGDPSLLFVAHRREILEQSLATFRQALRDGTFGELYVGGARPATWRHVFASIQSLQSLDPERLAAESFDVVIVDEFHHAAAPTYERLLARLTPRVLLGLTATPERPDGRSVTGWFGDRLAAELRLWDALADDLLCPFHYFGINDETDLSGVAWRRGGYDTAALERVYTADDRRLRFVVTELQRRVPDLRTMRALGFCVSVAHARYMAARFVEAGIPALAITGDSPDDERADALRRLRARELNVLFSVDLYNEGVDLPDVDTLLLLRPTESATVFLQQLGRGLRKADEKRCCTVLDFIGQQHKRFRFDLRYRALSGASRRKVVDEIERGFPHLPSGGHFELDSVAKERVLANIRASLPSTRKHLVDELRGLRREVSLAEFLRESVLEPGDIYSGKGASWTELRRCAGLPTPGTPAEPEAALLAALGRFLHVDDRERLDVWARLLASDRPVECATLSPRERRLAHMLHFLLRGTRPAWGDVDASLAEIWQFPAVRAELRELLALLEDRSASVPLPLGWPVPVPLHVHAAYTRDEIRAAFGELKPASSGFLNAGVFWAREADCDVLLVTLVKSEREFSPTTRYEDYPLSRREFHWQSQSTTGVRSPTGQRYLRQRERDGRVLLFVRHEKRDERGSTTPYLCLGPVRYVRHEGDRPISIVWELAHEMPVAFFQAARVGGA